MHALDILGDPVRRRLVELLRDGEQPAGALGHRVTAEFGISQPAVSQHLRVLREAGFTSTSDTSPMPHPLGRLGAVVREDGDVLLRFERRYDAPVPDVWSALTDPDRLARWLGQWTGDPASGQVLLTMGDEGSQPEPVAIERCDPPTRLDVTMTTADGPWPLSVLLTETDGGTALLVTHKLAEPYDASGVGPGWHYFLDRLDAVLAGTAVPHDSTAYHPRLADAYPVPAAAPPLPAPRPAP